MDDANEQGVGKGTAAASAAATPPTTPAKSDIKIPTDLSKVSNAKAKELVDNGLVEDSDLPGKVYKRKQDGFVARIPNYTFDAYGPDLQDEWEEVTLTTEAQPAADAEKA